MSEEHQEQERQPIGAAEYVAPMMNRRAYHCPHCRVYAPQGWWQLSFRTSLGDLEGSHIYRGECFNCNNLTFWWHNGTNLTRVEERKALMVIPTGSSNAPLPHPDFPDDPKADYEEARSIVDRSPRGAAALLRLALQKLCGALEESGKDINEDIAALVVALRTHASLTRFRAWQPSQRRKTNADV